MRNHHHQIDIHAGQRGQFVTPATVAKVLGVSRRTAERYAQARQLPTQARRLLEYELLGVLPDPAFAGFYVDSGALMTPSGRRLLPAQLEWIELVYQLAATVGMNG